MVKGTILIFAFLSVILCENTILFEEKQQSLVFKADWHPNTEGLSEYITKFHKSLKQTDKDQINLSFSYCSSPNYLLQSLFQGIFSATKVRINLDGCRIGNEGIKYIVKILKSQKLRSLTLDLSSTDIDDNGLKLLSEFLSESSLEMLQIKLVFLKMGDKGAFNFMSHPLPASLVQLSIDLTFNKLGFKSIESFQQYLSKIQENQLKVLRINLGSNNIQQKGANLLKESLKRFNNIQQLHIDVYFNKIGPKGCEHIANIAKNQQQITNLTLNFDANSIQTEGGKSIAESIINKTTLTSLQIGVANKNFGFNGFAIIVDSISTLPSLKQLTIRVGVNRIGYKGAQKLTNSIQKLSLQTLTLGLSQNFLTDQGIKIIGDSIKNQKQLKTLKINLGFNEARGYGPVSILKTVQQSNITHLQIGFSQNPLEDAEIKLFIPYLSSILKKAEVFQFTLLETKISEKLAHQLSIMFRKASQTNPNIKLTINNEQQTNRIRQQIQTSNKPLLQSSDL